MEKELKLLKEWAVNYIKNKDILTKFIEEIDESPKEWDIAVKTKTGEKYYLVVPDIGDFNEIAKRIEGKSVVVVALNTKKNLDVLIKNWENAAKHPGLCFIFVNPDSEIEKKWIVFPYTHEKVTEKKSLERGLKALFQTVDVWK